MALEKLSRLMVLTIGTLVGDILWSRWYELSDHLEACFIHSYFSLVLCFAVFSGVDDTTL
jgi:hypothetical protein